MNQGFGKAPKTKVSGNCTWQFFVTFMGWWKRDLLKRLSDLQRLGFKRSRLESPGRTLKVPLSPSFQLLWTCGLQKLFRIENQKLKELPNDYQMHPSWIYVHLNKCFDVFFPGKLWQFPCQTWWTWRMPRGAQNLPKKKKKHSQRVNEEGISIGTGEPRKNPYYFPLHWLI